MIELSLAFQDKDGAYAEHAGAVLASVFCNTSSSVNVHILHDETLTEANKQKLIELTSSFNQTIHFYPVTIPDNMLQAMAGVKSISFWTQASMYRLLIPALIPVDKIIYLDCDVLVNMNIAELWEVQLGDFYLAAVWDQAIMAAVQHIIPYGLNPDSYFDSGVILFALNNIRKKIDWYEEMLNFLRRYPDTSMPDQDTLNAVFGENYLQLDRRFNFFNMVSPHHDFNNKIVHFAGSEKCWDVHSPGANLYQEYLSLTPWKKHTDETSMGVHPLDGQRDSKSKNLKAPKLRPLRRVRKSIRENMYSKKRNRRRIKVRRKKIIRLSLTETKYIKLNGSKKAVRVGPGKRVRRPRN